MIIAETKSYEASTPADILMDIFCHGTAVACLLVMTELRITFPIVCISAGVNTF